MRSVMLLIAAGAISLSSTMAMAADMPIAPPPVYAPPPAADFGGWYLRGDVGFSNQSVSNVRSTNNAAYNGTSGLTQQSAFDSAGIFDIGVGYRFNSWFRADVTGQYRGKSNFKGTDVFSTSGYNLVGSGQDSYTASKSELLFLANAYVDLGTWWCVTPFIGAGVGAARVSISNFADNGVSNLHAPDTINGIPAYVGGPLLPSYVSAPSASRWNFAWAAHAGLAYQVSPNLVMELAYSYVSMGDGYTGPARAFDGSVGGSPFKFRDITSHDLKLGVRWNFDNPPPPMMMPPLIRKG